VYIITQIAVFQAFYGFSGFLCTFEKVLNIDDLLYTFTWIVFAFLPPLTIVQRKTIASHTANVRVATAIVVRRRPNVMQTNRRIIF
jgi:hypothetical protein